MRASGVDSAAPSQLVGGQAQVAPVGDGEPRRRGQSREVARGDEPRRPRRPRSAAPRRRGCRARRARGARGGRGLRRPGRRTPASRGRVRPRAARPCCAPRPSAGRVRRCRRRQRRPGPSPDGPSRSDGAHRVQQRIAADRSHLTQLHLALPAPVGRDAAHGVADLCFQLVCVGAPAQDASHGLPPLSLHLECDRGGRHGHISITTDVWTGGPVRPESQAGPLRSAIPLPACP